MWLNYIRNEERKPKQPDQGIIMLDGNDYNEVFNPKHREIGNVAINHKAIQRRNNMSATVISAVDRPRQANLCLRAFRHDKF